MNAKINSKFTQINKAICKRLFKNKGEAYVDTVIKILIGVVVGALLLGLIVTLINTLWPELTQRILDMFSLGGSGTPSGSPAP